MAVIRNSITVVLTVILGSLTCLSQPTRQKIDPVIVDQITHHYMAKHKEDVAEKKVSDSLVTISFRYKGSYDTALANEFLTVYIPRWQRSNLTADFDGDGTREVIGSVSYTSGVMGAVNGNDIFVFAPAGKTYKLVTVANSSEVSGCEGDFYPEMIEAGLIKGRSVCWAEEDARCCPTLVYSTTVRYVKGRFILLKRSPGTRVK